MKKTLPKILAAGAAFSSGFLFCLWFMTASAFPEAVSVSVGQDLPVLVIDAGHGGFDGGAQAADGTKEKDINLAISLELARIASRYPVEVILTRAQDEALYMEETSASKKREDLLRRKEIMKEADADLAVSIHLNSFPQNTGVFGAQVFYPADEPDREDGRTDEQNEEQSSRALAESVQNALETDISDGRERTAMKKKDILLFQDPPCRIILVECGFLSCPTEAEKLKTPEYQRKLADAIWKGINEKLCLAEKENIPVVESTNRQERD
ncbi:MAG: N-acetylmuramoyl-L-alanine amidase [Anaerovoracaceae bacterium]